MKKIISFVLCMTMLVSLMPYVAYGAVSYNGEESAKLLENLFDIKVENYNREITRGEFIYYVSIVSGMYKFRAEQLDEKPFNDIEPDDEYASAIDILKRAGFISGHTDGGFHKDEGVTTNEAAVILLKMLGYEKRANALGGYPYGYMTVANNLGLLKGAGAESYYSNIKVSDALIYLVNALNCEMLQVVSFSDDSVKTATCEGETLLYLMHNIKRQTGVVKGVDITFLPGSSEVKPYSISVNDVVISINNIKYNEYLGYDCDVYYDTLNGENTLKYIRKTDKNNETVINAEDIEDINNKEIIVYRENQNSQRIKYEYAPVIYNGVSTRQAFSLDMVSGKHGRVILLDNNNDRKTDVIFVNVCRDIVVSSTDKISYTIYDKFDKNGKIELDETKDNPYVLIYDSNGDETTFGAIHINSVVSIYESKYDNNQALIKAYISNEGVTGVLKSKYYDGKYFVEIDEKTYEVTKECYERDKASLNSKERVTLYLNSNGIGVYATAAGGDGMDVGYIMKVKQTEKDLEKEILIKLYTEEGKFVNYKISKNVKIDDTKYRKEADKVISHLKASANEIGSNLDEGCFAQLIRFTLDSNGEINYIDTVLNSASGGIGTRENMEGNNLLFKKSGSYNYKINAGNMGGYLYIPSGSVVFRVPSSDKTAGLWEDEALFEVAKSSYFADNNNYNVICYYWDERKAGASLTTVINDGVPNYGSYETRFSFFKGVSTVALPDGEVVNKVTFYKDGKETFKYFEDGLSYEDIKTGKSFKFADLKTGDVFLFSTGKNADRISGFKLMYKVDEDKIYGDFVSDDTLSHKRCVLGYIQGAYEDGVVFKPTLDKGDLLNEDGCEIIGISSNFPVMIYDGKKPTDGTKLSIGTIKDIRGYKDSFDDCSKVLIQQNYARLISIYVIR